MSEEKDSQHSTVRLKSGNKKEQVKGKWTAITTSGITQLQNSELHFIRRSLNSPWACTSAYANILVRTLADFQLAISCRGLLCRCK